MVKSGLQSLLSSAILAPVWTPLVRERASVFTLHRFATPDNAGWGHDLGLLRRVLERLRRERYHPLDVEALALALREGEPLPPRALCFTVDDGYVDFASAAELFLAYDCPVTVFLATGFIDGTGWMWWDQITYLLERTSRPALEVELGGSTLRLRPGSPAERARLSVEVAERCKTVPDTEKWRFIRALAERAEVELPESAPAGYRALTWDEVRGLERRGVRFGAHSVTHPVLPATSDEQARREIAESWEVVRRRLERPSTVFSYPNGDFGEREQAAVAAAGMAAAVSTVPVYASAESCRGDAAALYRIPRFPYPDNADQLCLTVSGFSRVSLRVRRELRKIGWMNRAS